MSTIFRKIQKKRRSYITTFLFISVLIIYAINNKNTAKHKKSIERVTKSFEIVTGLETYKLAHGKLFDHKTITDSLGYKRVKASFLRDKILSNDEIDLSVSYAFMDRIYHGDEIKLEENEDIILEGDFYLSNKLVERQKYRSIRYIVFKDNKGNIRYNKSLDIIDNDSPEMKQNFNSIFLYITTSFYDNIDSRKIIVEKTVETYRKKDKLHWIIKDVKVKDNLIAIESLLKGIDLVYSVASDFTINELLNYTNIKNEIFARIDSIGRKHPNQIEMIDSVSTVLKSQLKSNESLKKIIGRDMFSYYRIYSDELQNEFVKNEFIPEYPYSKLPILLKTEISCINSFQDETHQYNVKSKIDNEKISDIDSVLDTQIFNRLINNLDYSFTADYYLGNNLLPYLVREQYIIIDKQYKKYRAIRIELLN